MNEIHPPRVHHWLLAMLRCPVTGAELELIEDDGEPALVSTDAERPLIYPVRDGVPVLLADEAWPAR